MVRVGVVLVVSAIALGCASVETPATTGGPSSAGSAPASQSGPPTESTTAQSLQPSFAPMQPITTQIGQGSASEDVDPAIDTTIEATGADGSRFALELPPFALNAPTTITLQPLAAATIPGGTLIAGVDIEPAGQTLQVPATLTITPARSGNGEAVIGLSYSGSGSANAELGDLGPGSSNASLVLMISHFSGALEAGLDPTGEGLWLQQGSYNDATIDGRQAHARHAIDVLDWAEHDGRIDHADAESSRDYWRQQWWEAEADRLANEMGSTIESGDIGQAVQVIAQATEMVKIGRDIGETGDLAAASAAIDRSIQLIGAYATNVINRLNGDTAFQSKLDAGPVGNIPDVLSVTGTLLGMARSLDQIGDSATRDQIVAAVDAWLKRLFESILERCRQEGGVPMSQVKNLINAAQFLGLPYSDSDFEACSQRWLITIDGRLERTVDLGLGTGRYEVHATYRASEVAISGSEGSISGSGPITISETDELYVQGKLFCTVSADRTSTVDVTGSKQVDNLDLRLQIPLAGTPTKCPGVANDSDPVWGEVLGDVRLPATGGTLEVTQDRTLGYETDSATGTFTLTVVPPSG